MEKLMLILILIFQYLFLFYSEQGEALKFQEKKKSVNSHAVN